MKEGARNLVTGIVGIVALGGFAALLMLFGELDFLRTGRWKFSVALNDAGGLRAGSVVMLNGVPVGAVQSVESRLSDPERPVLVEAMIEGDHSIPSPVVPSVQTSLIGGGAALQLRTSPETLRLGATYPRDGSAVVAGLYQTMPEQLAELVGGQLGPVAESLKSFGQLAATYEKLGRDLNELVAPISDEALSEGRVASLRVTIARFNATLAEAQELLTEARAWVGDEPLRSDVFESVRDAKALIADARDATHRFGDLAEGVRADAQELVRRLVPVADELSQTLAEVRRAVGLATSGQGTVAMLLNSPDLYRSLNDAAQRLERALAAAELLLEKIRQEGLKLDL